VSLNFHGGEKEGDNCEGEGEGRGGNKRLLKANEIGRNIHFQREGASFIHILENGESVGGGVKINAVGFLNKGTLTP